MSDDKNIKQHKRKMVMSNLVKNSMAAYYAAIEIHNKPNIQYRYETVTLLINNAWELILKAFIRKSIKDRSIYTENNHTITLDRALDYVNQYFNSIKPNSFLAIKENIELVEKYRNDVAHYYPEQLEPYIFMLVAKSALNYVDFLKTNFGKDIMDIDGLFIMPLGFKLPFKPEDFLSKNVSDFSGGKEGKQFITSIVKTIEKLDKEKVEDSIVVGFDIFFDSVKKCTNADIVARITKEKEADATFEKITNFRLSGDDSNAQIIKLSDEDFRKIWKHTYKELVSLCQKNITNFKKGKLFNKIMVDIKKDKRYSFERKLDMNNPKSASTFFYTDVALNEIKDKYEKEVHINV